LAPALEFAESLPLARQEQAPAACAADLAVESGINGLLAAFRAALGARGMTLLDNITKQKRLKRTGVRRHNVLIGAVTHLLQRAEQQRRSGVQIQINDAFNIARCLNMRLAPTGNLVS
jgi:hypothetical protein